MLRPRGYEIAASIQRVDIKYSVHDVGYRQRCCVLLSSYYLVSLLCP